MVDRHELLWKRIIAALEASHLPFVGQNERVAAQETRRAPGSARAIEPGSARTDQPGRHDR